MISCDKFVDDLLDAEGWPYASPGSTSADCSKSGIDCSGMAVRAFKLQGDKSLYHGCNTMWRDDTFSDKGVLTSASQLQKGYAVLLNRGWRETDSGNKWYGDKDGNMTHIGYVVSTKPLKIIDASASAGKVRITTDIKKVGWNRWGRFAKMDYQEKAEEQKGEKAMTMKVHTSNGGTLNVRKRTSTTSDRVATVPDGALIEVVKDMGDWSMVNVEGQSGYVLSKFLTVAESAQTVEERLANVERMVQQLMNAVFEG